MERARIDKLSASHQVKRNKSSYYIKLNKPPDIIYDISDIEIEYNIQTGAYIIHSKDLTSIIKDNILRFQYMNIEDFILWVESNLNFFCMGQVPEAPPTSPIVESTFDRTDDEISSNISVDMSRNKPIKLPSNYQFPGNMAVTPNIQYEAMKSNILLFVCKSINVTVKCTRCKAIQAIHESICCVSCRCEFDLTYIPVSNSEYFGFLALKHCTFVSFNPCRYQLSCENCGTNYETPLLNFSDVFAFSCFNCFASIKLTVAHVYYIQKQSYNLKVGCELPNKGACKHYKKSLRWFRFSCCNNLYPCDICHDEENDHPHMEAKRMVCGLCSQEQSVKGDCSCGMSMEKKHSRFWEGGRGNRDKATMSRNDSRKYKK